MKKRNKIEQQIYDLVANTCHYMELTEGFVTRLVSEKTNAEIVELANNELQKIEYFVRIESEGFTYWKDKKSRLLTIINITK